MRVTTFLCLLLLLAIYAALKQGVGVQHPPAGTPALPTATSTAESKAFLSRWDDRQHRYEVGLVDLDTGRNVPGRVLNTISKDSLYTLPAVISADGQKLAAVGSRGQSCEPFAGGTSCRPSADVLYLGNLPTWRHVTTTLPGQGWIGPFVFNPQASTLALSYQEKKTSLLMLFDTATGQLIAQRALEFRPSLVGYDQAGTTLVIYGAPLGADPGISPPDSPRLVLVNAATLETQWERSLENILSGNWCEENCAAPHEQRLFVDWSPAVVLSHEGHKLYLVHADEARLTTVDLVAHEVHSLELQAVQGWFEEILAFIAGEAQAKGGGRGAFKSAVLSPDGTRLYVLGRKLEATANLEGFWETSETSLGLQVIDVESGQELASRDVEASGIKLGPDGVYVLLDGWDAQGQWTEVLDANSLESLTRLTGWEVVVTRRTDGRPAILARRPEEELTQLAVLDAQSFEIVRAWPVNGYVSWVAMP